MEHKAAYPGVTCNKVRCPTKHHRFPLGLLSDTEITLYPKVPLSKDLTILRSVSS